MASNGKTMKTIIGGMDSLTNVLKHTVAKNILFVPLA
jgi:hypothetical protein